MRLTKDKAQNLLDRVEELDSQLTELVDDLIIYGDSETYGREERAEAHDRLEENLPELANSCMLILAYVEPERLKPVK
jgi:hypothetical protein